VCILVHASTQSAASTHRLEAVRDSCDGFALSQKDLEIRGEGDVLGQDQSGALSSLRLLKVIEDLDFIDKVRHEIDELFTSKLWGQVIETIDIFEIQRAEYLEKS
jgi:ATP-dependent DNA helicase RecG